MEALITAAIELVSDIIARTPTWPQARAAEFHKLREDYYAELKKDYDLRDDERLLDLRDKLRRYIEDFRTVLSAQGVSPMHSEAGSAGGTA